MDVFGRYQLLKRVAVGGMAEIFLARSASINGFEKHLVIKRIRPEYSADPQFSSRFIDEARISMTLSHQNIVQVFDFGQVESSYYLAMEHVHGCDLEAVMNLDNVVGKGFDPALALFIMREVCRGLDYAHSRKGRGGESLGVVHRDISPHNILLSLAGEVKITDFGIAQARGQMSSTTPGVVLGKIGYMSPEHATGMPVDQRTDIYSAGIVLWEMLVGDAPFQTGDPAQLVRRIRDALIDPPSKRNTPLPGKLDDLVMRALAKEPEDRYQSAREFADAIHAYLAHRHPETSGYSLQAFLQERSDALEVVDFEDLPTVPHAAHPIAPPKPPGPTGTAILLTAGTPRFDWKPEVIRVIEMFRKEPNLWLFVRMGDLSHEGGQRDAAIAFYHAAAAKFAQRGLLAQALLASRRMLDLGTMSLRDAVTRLPQLVGKSDDEVRSQALAGSGTVEDLLRELLSDTNPSHGVIGEGTPLLAYIDGEAFADFAAMAPLKKFPLDAKVIEQGGTGRTMFLLATGRVLVYVTNADGKRAYLSSFTAGDFIGENGFFTGSPRSATIEAIYPVEAFEIDRALYDRLMTGKPQASTILLRFYKERIVDAVLAKSPTFCLLPTEDRRSIRDKFELQRFEAGDVIIHEGELSDQIYLIKDGTADVLTEKAGKQTVLSTLGPCAMFGEVAALRGIPRTASVVARSKLEAMRLNGADFQTVLAGKPEVRKRVLDEVARRVRENMDKLVRITPVS